MTVSSVVVTVRSVVIHTCHGQPGVSVGSVVTNKCPVQPGSVETNKCVC